MKYTTKMTKEDTEHMIALMEAYHSEDPKLHQKAKEQLLDENKKLLTHFIVKYAGSYLPEHMDDMYNEMVIMFLENIGKFDPRKATLSTFLTTHALRALANYKDSIGKCSNSYYAKTMRQVQDCMDQLQEKNAEVTVDTIAMKTGLSANRVISALDLLRATDVVSYDVPSDEQDRLEKQMVDFGRNPETEAIQKEASRLLQEAIQTLNPQDAEILMTKYGSGENVSLAETAKRIGIPVTRVKRSITRSLKFLRKDRELNEWYGKNKSYYTAPDGEEVSFLPSMELLDDYDLLDDEEPVKMETKAQKVKKTRTQLTYAGEGLPIFKLETL